MFHSNSLPYLQCSISMNAAGVYLIAGLYWDRQLMGTVASPEVCLYSRSCFLYSCDILTTSEVSQLFQRIHNGNRSPYLTFTVQTAYFVVVILYLFGLSSKGFWASLWFVSLFSFPEWLRRAFGGAESQQFALSCVTWNLLSCVMSTETAGLLKKGGVSIRKVPSSLLRDSVFKQNFTVHQLRVIKTAALDTLIHSVLLSSIKLISESTLLYLPTCIGLYWQTLHCS